MKVMIYIELGLGTLPTSDWCGLRSFVEELAATLQAEIIVRTWDGPQDLAQVTAGGEYDFIITIGHSHGAGELYKQLQAMAAGSIDLAVYLDLCPVGDPLAHLFGNWPAPPAAVLTLSFVQTNDSLVGLGGVKVGPDAIDVTSAGLHHAGAAGMCADSRVQTRIGFTALKAFMAKRAA